MNGRDRWRVDSVEVRDGWWVDTMDVEGRDGWWVNTMGVEGGLSGGKRWAVGGHNGCGGERWVESGLSRGRRWVDTMDV